MGNDFMWDVLQKMLLRLFGLEDRLGTLLGRAAILYYNPMVARCPAQNVWEWCVSGSSSYLPTHVTRNGRVP